MCRRIVVSLAAFLVFVGCSNEKKSNAANFTKAINEYLAKHGQVCTLVDQAFPANVTLPEQKQQTGIGPQTSALEQAGLMACPKCGAAEGVWCLTDNPTPNGKQLPLHQERWAAARRYGSVG